MSTLVEGITLQKFTRPEGPCLLVNLPESFTLFTKKKQLLSITFPEINTNNTIYSFSIKVLFGFCWVFTYENELYSICIGTRYPYAVIFFDFLKDAIKLLKKEIPEARVNKMYEVLKKWRSDPNSPNVIAPFLSAERIYPLDVNLTHFMAYDPSVFVNDEAKIDDLWNSLVTGKGILLIGNTPEQASQAAYSVLSLIAPYKYIEMINIYTGLGDPRFLDIINGSTKWKIVATTNALAADRCQQFKTIIKLPARNYNPSPELRAILQKKTAKLFYRIELQFNKRIEVDPYSDILEYPLSAQQINEIIQHLKMTTENFDLLQKMNFFQEWKKSIIFRSKFRESFLSFIPKQVIATKNEAELKKISKILEFLSSKYKNDIHMSAVISEHIKLVNNRLQPSQ
ncbi:hypothetical protein TVAG_444740 [Trichomonas vaginalis G3]|uniref:UDENN domain-containing protein n=1 Tax=Trichomonas vaginalis (strain ATCC PRA-98 / G3) TaxID=412133 RepID=A2FRX2_TRIV3|nr:UDENN domain family [Trichomonas vaginalis G3]EAX92338.1 hypothetical protein TVAG_444740 [Trichomonas vaginalis G3]KAI5506410.1 UDENN domain family [Trichomonas vaginalis G3]|eukprot:XP_001305268.1 hypothetical protein [Trichomonas vaginalis G3]